jgi:hypothetical protein
MTDIYKEVLCQFIQAGRLTLQEVEEMKAHLESTSIERSRQTPTWVAAEAFCKQLNEGITANSYRPFKMNVTNVSAMEKLLRIDGVTNSEVEAIVKWCLAHEFWSSVILSPAKFRKHFNTMQVRSVEERYKAERNGAKPATQTAVSAQPKVVSDEELYERQRQRQAEAVPMPKDFKRMVGLNL